MEKGSHEGRPPLEWEKIKRETILVSDNGGHEKGTPPCSGLRPHPLAPHRK